jgi:uncharacterized protein
MKVLIDIGHPAHVHIFKHFAWTMERKHHMVFFTCRDKEFEVRLLKSYGFNYKILGRKYNSIIGKIWGMLKFDLKMVIEGLSQRPDVFLSHGSIYAAHAAFILRKPNISLEDTGNKEQVRLYLPFTKAVLSPEGFQHNYGAKHLFYNGFHQLAYLHKSRFTPDPTIYQHLALEPQEKYVVVRFVSYNASHDISYTVLNNDDKIRIISEIPQGYRIFISSEGELPEALKKYALTTSPELIHSVLAFSSLYIGQSSTMAAEAAFLGVPSIFIHSENEDTEGVIDYLDENNIFKIVRYGKDQVTRILDTINLFLENNAYEKRDFSSTYIDVSDYLTWFVENFPESFELQKKDKTLPDRFIKKNDTQQK